MADGKFDPAKYPLDVVVLTICEDTTGKVLRWYAEKLHGQIGQGDVVGVPKDPGGHVNIDGQGLRPAEVDGLKYAPAELDGGKWLDLIGREELATDGDESLGRTLGKQVVEEGNPFQCFDVVAELASHKTMNRSQVEICSVGKGDHDLAPVHCEVDGDVGDLGVTPCHCPP